MFRGHGSPYDRGDSDAYYGRLHDPHKWDFSQNFKRRTVITALSSDEQAEYDRGYRENPSGKKEWM